MFGYKTIFKMVYGVNRYTVVSILVKMSNSLKKSTVKCRIIIKPVQIRTKVN